MNRNYRVIKINGFRGILTALFAIGCLITGFLVCPGWVFMNLWNYVASYNLLMPKMQLVHGIMLWSIVALSLYALNNNRCLIGFSAPPQLSEDQIRDIVTRVKNSASQSGSINTESNECEEKTETLDEIRK